MVERTVERTVILWDIQKHNCPEPKEAKRTEGEKRTTHHLNVNSNLISLFLGCPIRQSTQW